MNEPANKRVIQNLDEIVGGVLTRQRNPKRVNVIYLEQQHGDANLKIWKCKMCTTEFWADINLNVEAPKRVYYEGFCCDDCRDLDEFLEKDGKNESTP